MFPPRIVTLPVRSVFGWPAKRLGMMDGTRYACIDTTAAKADFPGNW